MNTISQVIGGIIGIIITVCILNWWKYRHLFEVDLKRDMPFTYEWLNLSQEERDKRWAKMCVDSKKEWEHRYATMTDDEIEEKYCLLTVYSNKEDRIKREAEERIILAKRGIVNAGFHSTQ